MTQFQNVSNNAHATKCDLASAVLCSSGKLRLRVNGWSMLPAVMPGDTLVIERAGNNEISDGDIVLFRRNRRLIAHRVVATCEDGRAITRGDAMPHPDTPAVTASELLGRVSLIVRNGRCIEPRAKLGVSRRIVVNTIRRSTSAARIFLGAYGIRQGLKEFVFACQS